MQTVNALERLLGGGWTMVGQGGGRVADWEVVAAQARVVGRGACGRSGQIWECFEGRAARTW